MRYCIEYELWNAGGPVKVGEFGAFLRSKYQNGYSPSNLVNRLTELRGDGSALRLARGIYVHTKNLPKVKATPTTAATAPTVDIFS
jgi:hypothetical protein